MKVLNKSNITAIESLSVDSSCKSNSELLHDELIANESPTVAESEYEILNKFNIAEKESDTVA
jgi:hypothetical protein